MIFRTLRFSVLAMFPLLAHAQAEQRVSAPDSVRTLSQAVHATQAFVNEWRTLWLRGGSWLIVESNDPCSAARAAGR